MYFEVGDEYFSRHFCVISLLLKFVLSILVYFFPVLGSAADSHIQLFQVHSVTLLRSDQGFSSLSHRLHVFGLPMLYMVISNTSHCWFGELPSAAVRDLHSRASVAAHPFEY